MNHKKICPDGSVFVSAPGSWKEFLLAEFKELRDEIEAMHKQIGECANFAVITSAATWGWLLTRDGWQTKYPQVAMIPSAMTLLFAFRWLALQHAMSRNGKYILEVEKKLTLPKPLGWETFLKNQGRSWLLGIWHGVYYLALLAGNTWLAKLAPYLKTESLDAAMSR